MNMYQRRYVARRIDEEAAAAVRQITRRSEEKIWAIAQLAKDRIILKGEGSGELARVRTLFRSIVKGGDGA